MNTTEYFKRTIQAYLEERAIEDELFAAKYDNPDKNIDDCVTYILNWVQKSGCNGFCDDEIYGQAIHYYEEKDIEVGKPLNCQVSVNHHIELTEEEKAQARQEAIRQYQQEQMNKMRNRDTAKRTSQRTDNEVHQPLINNQTIEDFSLVIAHEQLEQLINDAELEEWNNRQGISEEAAEAFRSENGKMWGLRRGGMMMVEPKYLRVFNIKEGLAAVRLQDSKLAVVDMKGNIVRGLGNGISALICSKDFAEVERNNDYDYIDLLSGQIYYDLPRIVSEKEPQLMRASSNGLILRLKDPFVYGSIDEETYFKPVKEYNYFYMIHMSGYKADVERYAVDTLTLIVIKGDNERAYWLYDVHEDGSIDVIDRQCNAYHVMPDGTKEKLNRCDILEHSQAVLKEIDIQYRKEGGDPYEQYKMYRFRNRILYSRLSEKLKVLKNKHKL